MRIHIPPNYPPESIVLFVLSTWHVLIALLISRVGVLRKETARNQAEVALASSVSLGAEGA